MLSKVNNVVAVFPTSNTTMSAIGAKSCVRGCGKLQSDQVNMYFGVIFSGMAYFDCGQLTMSVSTRLHLLLLPKSTSQSNSS